MGNKLQKNKSVYNKEKYLLQEQNNTVKNKCHSYIQKGEFIGLKEYMKSKNIFPNEELSEKGNDWTAIHYACHFKKPDILVFLLKEAKKKYPDNYDDIMKMTSKDGWNSLMISSIYNSFHCLKVLLYAGGIDIMLVDNNGSTALELAQKYNAVECIDELNILISQNQNQKSTLIPINTIALQENNDELTNIVQKSLIDYNIKIEQQSQVQMPNEQDNLLLNEKSNGIKNQCYQYIKSGDLSNLLQYVQQHLVKPNEEISVKGNFWTMLHYACHFGQKDILMFLLKRTYQFYPFHFQKVMSLETKDGWTAFMLSAIYKQPECMELMIQVGGIDLYKEDHKGQRVLDLAKKYGNLECINLISELEKKDIQQIQLNINLLSKENQFDAKENVNEDNYLAIQGVRKPCIICFGNDGYIVYSICCHTPLHFICYDDLIDKVCLECKQQNLEITPEITNLSKAFQR